MSSQNERFFTAAFDIDKVAKDCLVRPSPPRDAAIPNSERNGLPAVMITPLHGQYLAIQARLMGARSVLEIGTLGGYSSLFFAEAGCKVTSVEINPKHRDVALQNIAHAGHADKVEVILGAALDVLPRLVEEGRVFDFVFIDADWGEQYECLDWALKMTRPKSCVYIDNVIRPMREQLNAGKDLGKDSLAAKVGKDERVTATLIQTVSENKTGTGPLFDGFLLAIVN
ncbi:hypothetical protein VP1G_05859 [Cytospora mali]|uniref:O-methyltransferase MdmC n=1 Tax=Cytospora mali TaxID=578113 RepID=A0A194V3Z4_CYTMA|nr:hypothetical protein VP1G_05859 [Valsa mali var. pyri (nom. inval.)]